MRSVSERILRQPSTKLLTPMLIRPRKLFSDHSRRAWYWPQSLPTAKDRAVVHRKISTPAPQRIRKSVQTGSANRGMGGLRRGRGSDSPSTIRSEEGDVSALGAKRPPRHLLRPPRGLTKRHRTPAMKRIRPMTRTVLAACLAMLLLAARSGGPRRSGSSAPGRMPRTSTRRSTPSRSTAAWATGRRRGPSTRCTPAASSSTTARPGWPCASSTPACARARSPTRPNAWRTKATGIPASHILISATHTHTAPTLAGVFQSEANAEYVKQLPGLIARGIQKANENLRAGQGRLGGRRPTPGRSSTAAGIARHGLIPATRSAGPPTRCR